MKSLLVVLIVTTVIGCSWAHGNISEIIPLEGTHHIVICPYDDPVEYWLLHGEGVALMVGDVIVDEEISVAINGSLLFQHIQVKYEGRHVCVTKSQKPMAHPVEVKVRPLPPKDLWDAMYKGQFLTGLIAALVLFTIFALSCFVYNRRWRPSDLETGTKPFIEETGYDNPVMVHNSIDEDESSSTKM